MWAKVDDQWWMHPKVMGLSLQARGLWVTALSWSGARRDPHVPPSFVAMVCAGQDPETLTDELTGVGLWHKDADGGWVIHDWDEYQEMTTSEKRAAAGRKGGKKSGEARRADSTDEAPEQPDRSPDEANAKQTDSPAKQEGSEGEATARSRSPEPEPEPEPVPKVKPLGADGAPPETVELEEFDVPFPIGGADLTGLVLQFVDDVGLAGGKPAPRDPPARARWAMKAIAEVLGDGTRTTRPKQQVCVELIAATCGSDPPQAMWAHLGRLVTSHDGVQLVGALAKAIVAGAGLTEGYVDDPLALSKYATAVLRDDDQEDAA